MPARTVLPSLVLGVLSVAAPALAQSTFGTVTGTVTDATGAVLPGVTITATHLATGGQRTVASDPTGGFQLPNLDAGRHRVEASLQGFADRVREVELLARQTLRVDMQLPVAGTSETLTVTGAAGVIETDRATLDSSKSGDDINKLALNFRASGSTSPIVVATTAPSVQQDRQGQLSIAGNLPFMTSFSVDGISAQRTRGGGPSREMFPSVESIQEFKVSAANNNAEFMQVTDITTTTKSGTNQVRGTAFWFNQDSQLSSVNRFAPRDAAGVPIKPDVKADSFGVSVGGPIASSRSFFFATFEGVRRSNERTLAVLVPPDAFRSGDLSSVSRAIVNPFTGQPFPDNQIPVHPSSAAVLDALYERQNRATGASLSAPNYVVNAPGEFTVNGFDARFDHAFTPAQKTFVRLSTKMLRTAGPDASTSPNSYNTRQGEAFRETRVRQLAANHHIVIGADLLHETRGGFSDTIEKSGYPLAAEGANLINRFRFTGLPPTPASGGIPSFEFGDGTFISTGGDKPRHVLSRTVQVNDNLTWLRGTHTFKGGADVQYVEYKDQVTFFAGEDFGRYVFNGTLSGNAFADFLLGLPTFTAYAKNAPDVSPFTTQLAFYAQDDWRPTPRLTVNYGVRYDLRPPMRDRSNQLGNFDRAFPGGRVVVANAAQLAQVSPALRASLPNTPFVTAAEVGLPQTLRYTDTNNVNPRLGAAFRPFGDNQTVIRGGIGTYTVPLYGAVNYSLAGVVTSDVPLFQNRASGTGYAIQFPNVFPSSIRAEPGAGTQDFRRANQFDLRDPKVTQWTATFERDLGWQTGLRLSYVGSRTVDIVWSPDLNQVRPNTQGYAAVRDTRPYRDWNVVTTRDNGPRARYDGLTIEVSKRQGGGLSFNHAYTLAKHQSDSGGAVPDSFAAENGATTLDRYRLDADYGDVAFTRRHRFVSTFLYELPFGRDRAFGRTLPSALDAVLGGWDVTGITLLQSGPFLTAFFGNADPSGTGTTVRGFTANQRPDCVGDGNLVDPTADRYFDVSAFVRPPNNVGRFGNCAVGTLRGPGTRVFSMTLGKNVHVVGASRARFEVAFSNLFDIENLDVPPTNITASAFGRITGTQPVDQAGPRTIQFSLRYSF